ncbi:MAG TPA: DUF4173 domain-containing protein [Actinomycetota bacterium]|nr:DUF4173 domain-containing protein [Actinomycetota bacterium]
MKTTVDDSAPPIDEPALRVAPPAPPSDTAAPEAQDSIWAWTAIIVAGAIAAWLIPFTRAGINVPIAGVFVVVAVVMALRGPRTKTRLLLLCASVLVTIPFAFIDAEWVLAIDMLAALALIALASVDAERVSQILALPIRFLMATPLTHGVLVKPPIRTLGPRIAATRLINVAKTVVLASTLLLVFGSLFSSADSDFAELMRDLLPDINMERIAIRSILFMIVVIGTAYVAVAGESKEITPGEPWFAAAQWKTTLVLLNAMFTAFIALQMKVLFGGHALVQQTSGLTYAEHARSGFFQLIAASALTFVVLAAAGRHYSKSSEVRALLGILCGLTLIVLASALTRLQLYEEVFGFTSSRMFAHAVILWLGALMLMVVALAAAGRHSWIPRAAFAVTVVAVMLFNFVNPDRKVAQLNVDRYEAGGKYDISYCYEISADAVPELLRLPSELRPYLQTWARNQLKASDPIAGWNASRENARELLKASALKDSKRNGDPMRFPIDESC